MFLMSAAILLKLFFVEKSDGRKDWRLYTRTSSSEETGGSGPDCGAVYSPLM